MSLPPTIPAAIIEAILPGLAALFLIGAGGDIQAARNAALRMLGSYDPETEDELRLAASIIGFSFHALEALAQAMAPDIPMTRMLRLRGSAVSLSRESAKAERRLAQLRKTRQPAAPVEIRREPEPKIEQIQKLGTVAAAAKANGLTWTKASEQRQRDLRLAARLKKSEAQGAPRSNIPIPLPVPHHGAMARAI